MTSSKIPSIIQGWRKWWAQQGALERLLPLALIGVFLLALLALGGLRDDHLRIAGIVAVLAYAGPIGRAFLKFVLPLILTGIVYDSQRFWGHLFRGRIRVREPYDFDLRFFGIPTSNGLMTPNEWWQQNTHPLLDLIAGFGYLVFIAGFVALAAYFHFWLSRRGTRTRAAAYIAEHSPKMMWAFFVLNVVGYSTYYWYPAAPPWYSAKFGFGPAILETPPDPAGCLRFDALLGIDLFQQMYSRSADVFGAVPSLHVAYPLLGVVFAFHFGTARALALAFYALLCFSAVYLNHHYVLDILWGSAYALAIGWLFVRLPGSWFGGTPEPIGKRNSGASGS